VICAQDQQLCLLFKLQVLSAVSGLHIGVLSVRSLHVNAVLHHVLAGKTPKSVLLFLRRAEALSELGVQLRL